MGKNFKVSNNQNEYALVENETVLDCLRRNKVNIRSSCGGHSTCSDCVIRVKSGEKSLNPVNFEEKKLLGNVYFITKERLACQVECQSVENDDSIEIEIVNLD